MRESSSESDDIELESNYSSSENDDDIKGCYMNEPEYLEKEINAMNILENENFSGNSEESDLYSSRLENLHWCFGFEYGISLTMRVQECKCCCECKSPLGDKLKDVKCITSNSEFHILCLNKIVLETAFTAIEGTKINTAR